MTLEGIAAINGHSKTMAVCDCGLSFTEQSDVHLVIYVPQWQSDSRALPCPNTKEPGPLLPDKQSGLEWTALDAFCRVRPGGFTCLTNPSPTVLTDDGWPINPAAPCMIHQRRPTTGFTPKRKPGNSTSGNGGRGAPILAGDVLEEGEAEAEG